MDTNDALLAQECLSCCNKTMLHKHVRVNMPIKSSAMHEIVKTAAQQSIIARCTTFVTEVTFPGRNANTHACHAKTKSERYRVMQTCRLSKMSGRDVSR